MAGGCNNIFDLFRFECSTELCLQNTVEDFLERNIYISIDENSVEDESKSKALMSLMSLSKSLALGNVGPILAWLESHSTSDRKIRELLLVVVRSYVCLLLENCKFQEVLFFCREHLSSILLEPDDGIKLPITW